MAAGHVGNGASLKEAMYFIFKDVFTKNGIYDDAVIAKKMNEYLEEGVINSNMVIKEIEFLVKDDLLPYEILIHFKKRVFKLERI